MTINKPLLSTFSSILSHILTKKNIFLSPLGRPKNQKKEKKNKPIISTSVIIIIIT